MNKAVQGKFCLNVTGFSRDTDRRILRKEFNKFGKVEKLYVENSGKFANVFYDNKESCDLAIQELNKTVSQWQVQYVQKSENKISKSPSSVSSEMSNMSSYRSYDDEEDFSENFDYCNIHGQPLTVLQSDTGDIYVNAKDIRKTGFAIFRRDTFDSIPVDKRQILKEFDLHLLSEAKNYILKNKVAVIQEEDILKTIERCKNRLLGENNLSENHGNLGSGRFVVTSPGHNITVTTDVHSLPSTTNLPTCPQLSNEKPPKALPSNFMPTNNRNNETHKSKSQEHGSRSNQNNSNRYGQFKHNSNYNNGERNNFVNGIDISREKREPVELNTNNLVESNIVIKQSKTKIISPEDRNISVKEEIDKRGLDIGSTYQVQVVYTEDKENICWVQRKDDADLVEDILLKINEKGEELEDIKPKIGQLVIAQFEGAWSRGCVTSVNPPIVHFIDYGNKSPVESVKPLPDTFKNIPALAARIKINKSHVLNNEMTELTIKIKQQYDDGTYLAYLVDNAHSTFKPETLSTKSTEVEKPDASKASYFTIPKPMARLNSGDKVMVIDVEANKFLVRTKECAQKCKEITEYIKNINKSDFLLSNVKVGQLVLCSKDGLIGLYRAVVTKRENASVITVKYIDFPGEDDLSIKSACNVDNFLAHEPACILLTPEYIGLKDENVAEYISEICQRKEKCTVILDDGDFDLKFDNGTLLSEKLIELRSSKVSKEIESLNNKQSKEREPEPKASDKIMYDDMNWVSIKSGPHSFLCYRFNTIDDVTMIDTREEVINYFQEITGLEVTDDDPYMPEELEMCLVLYKGPDEEEASWCRATVLSIEDDDCDVSFVDFGNQERVTNQAIRKFPPNLKDIPILGINCELTGIPNTPEILKNLKKLIPEGDQVDVVVKGLSANNHHKYEIEIPVIYKLLQAKGLF